MASRARHKLVPDHLDYTLPVTSSFFSLLLLPCLTISENPRLNAQVQVPLPHTAYKLKLPSVCLLGQPVPQSKQLVLGIYKLEDCQV